MACSECGVFVFGSLSLSLISYLLTYVNICNLYHIQYLHHIYFRCLEVPLNSLGVNKKLNQIVKKALKQATYVNIIDHLVSEFNVNAILVKQRHRKNRVVQMLFAKSVDLKV